MSDFKEIKKDFLRDLVVSGQRDWRFLGDYKGLVDTVVPERLFNRWTQRFFKQESLEFKRPFRVVNHFKLGADPEFVFLEQGNVVNAHDLQLKAGLAIGADNNGRLAELRPTAHKSALMVVASLYAELCFLAQWNPALTKYNWYAQPFAGKDGLGGHIHFGRWHPAREEEVHALDRIMQLLTSAGCISLGLQKARLQTNLYGKYGDIRPQKHGYEYRTFPTWLGSPRQAHLYLTLAKLAVHYPALIQRVRTDAVTAQQTIDNILAYWQGLDDDAKIARVYLRHCFTPPKDYIQDAWGIVPVFNKAGNGPTDIIPPSIAPRDEDIRTMFEYLAHGTPLKMPQTPFEMLKFPEGCQPFQKVLVTDRRPELGEALWDLAMLPFGEPLVSVAGHNTPDRSLYLSSNLYVAARNKLCGLNFAVDGVQTTIQRSDVGGTQMSVPAWMLARQFQKATKKFLTESGVFPFVRLGQVLPDLNSWKIRDKEKLLLRA